MARCLKHENKFITYLIMKKKGKNNDNKSKCICMRYEILMQKQIQIGLVRRRMYYHMKIKMM